MKRVLFFSLLAVCMLNINVCAQTKSKSNIGSSQVVRIYKDALSFDLKGSVKSCSWEGGEEDRHDLRPYAQTLYFDKSGAITNQDIKVERNSENKITNITEENNIIFISYNKNGKVASMGFAKKDQLTPSVVRFEYDNRNRVIKALDFSSSNLLSDEPNNVIEFNYTKFDTHGNWTERKYEIPTPIGAFPFVEKRVIEYYP